MFGPRIAFSLLTIVLSAGIVLSQINPKGSKTFTQDEIESLKKKVEQFLSIDESNPITSNPHIYYNIAVEVLPHDVLLDLTERVVKQGISVNTYENLSKFHQNKSKSSIEHQQKLEFGRLYSQYAWILWKKGQKKNAFDTITKATSYISSLVPDDCLRLGIIEYGNGKKEQGWNHITEALMSDTIVEEQDPGYQRAIHEIVKYKIGNEKDPTTFIAEYRRQNAQMIPNLPLVTLENTPIDTHQFRGQIMFVNFFSPACSSCQQEIPSIRSLYKKFSPRNDVVFIFILNRPDVKQEAIALFEESRIDKPIIAILQNNSVWDFISVEPSIWITDKTGKMVFRHGGYKQDDELIYQQKLSRLIQE